MARSQWQCPREWSQWMDWLAAGLHGRCRWRLSILIMGILFAQGRRTVASWLRAAGVSDDFTDYYYFISAIGRKTEILATRLPVLLLSRLPTGKRLLFGILIALIALAHDPEKLNVWLVILVAGCFAAAYPMMYFLQDFIDLNAAIVLATALVIVVIAWRIISLFGLRQGVLGGIIVPIVLMGLTIAATIHAKPATQGVSLTIMGVFALVTAMILLPRAQANLACPKPKN